MPASLNAVVVEFLFNGPSIERNRDTIEGHPLNEGKIYFDLKLRHCDSINPYQITHGNIVLDIKMEPTTIGIDVEALTRLYRNIFSRLPLIPSNRETFKFFPQKVSIKPLKIKVSISKGNMNSNDFKECKLIYN